MPAKIARSAPRPPFGLPELTVAVRTSLLSCRKAGKTRIFTPVPESSGESRVYALGTADDPPCAPQWAAGVVWLADPTAVTRRSAAPVVFKAPPLCLVAVLSRPPQALRCDGTPRHGGRILSRP
jgi:hypothetical protein